MNSECPVNAQPILPCTLKSFVRPINNNLLYIDFVQLGFLPRNIAKWVAPLSDIGLFSFAAYIFPKEVLETAVEGSNKKVKLILYVYAV